MVLLLALVRLKEQEEVLCVVYVYGAVGYKADGKGVEEEGTDTALLHLHFLMAERNAQRVWI